MKSCEEINDQLSGYLDEELTQGDSQKVDVHLRGCPACQKILDEMRLLRNAVAGSQKVEKLQDDQWEKIVNDLPSKASAGTGWVLLIAGVLTLAGLGIWEFTVADDVSTGAKLGGGAVGFGLLLLFVSVLRQRLISWRTDKYKDIKY
ncbi:MAG: zf-HC2 domain-containing protein [Pirellulaceae bacterium]|nr:zf-HC2 domain-containing protein [Pirellulaceae bacterium]